MLILLSKQLRQTRSGSLISAPRPVHAWVGLFCFCVFNLHYGAVQLHPWILTTLELAPVTKSAHFCMTILRRSRRSDLA